MTDTTTSTPHDAGIISGYTYRAGPGARGWRVHHAGAPVTTESGKLREFTETSATKHLDKLQAADRAAKQARQHQEQQETAVHVLNTPQRRRRLDGLSREDAAQRHGSYPRPLCLHASRAVVTVALSGMIGRYTLAGGRVERVSISHDGTELYSGSVDGLPHAARSASKYALVLAPWTAITHASITARAAQAGQAPTPAG